MNLHIKSALKGGLIALAVYIGLALIMFFVVQQEGGGEAGMGLIIFLIPGIIAMKLLGNIEAVGTLNYVVIVLNIVIIFVLGGLIGCVKSFFKKTV